MTRAAPARRPEESRVSPLTVLGLIGATAGWGVGGTMTRLAVEELAPLTTTCLAYIWWNDGIRKIGAGRASMFSFVGPVAAMVSAVPLLGEWPGPAQLIGGALILGGLFASNRS